MVRSLASKSGNTVLELVPNGFYEWSPDMLIGEFGVGGRNPEGGIDGGEVATGVVLTLLGVLVPLPDPSRTSVVGEAMAVTAVVG